MDSIEDLMKRISINNYDVGSSHWVDVTYINNPHSFYVRPTVFRVYMSILNSYVERILPDELCLGSTIVYKSKLLQTYARGRIMFIQTEDGETSCDMYAPDYGCFEKSVPWKRLRRTCQPVDVPPLAIHCQLADCKPHAETWSRKVIECMKFFVGKERAKMVIRGKTPDSLIVELINSCPEDIATMLALSGHSTLGYTNNVINRFSVSVPEKHYFTFKEFDVGETLIVRVQAGDSLKNFYVAEVHNYKAYLNERDNFTYFSKKQKELQPEEVKEGMPVGVLMMANSKYERAYVKEITVPEEKAIVQLVDWGKIVEVPFMRLKAMSEKFFHRPALAIYCSAEESQTWDNGLHKFLYPGYEFKITIREAGDKLDTPYVVNIAPRVST